MFGCDVCQDVCPWNRFSMPHQEPLFQSQHNMLDWDRKQWEEITEETFKKVFSKSAVKRTKYKGLQRNIQFLKRRND
jgi:epoxyqueuosine reductase